MITDCGDTSSDVPEKGQEDIYKQVILDHYKHPRNQGELTSPTIKTKARNPVCGDQIEFSLLIKDNKIEDVKFKVQGCAVSTASASLLSEKLKGMTVDEIKALQSEDIFALLGVQSLGSSRAKCALLGLNTVLKGLKEKGF